MSETRIYREALAEARAEQARPIETEDLITDEVRRAALAWQVSREQALTILRRKDVERAAKQLARVDAEETHRREVTGQPVDAKTAAKLARRIETANRTRRARIAAHVGEQVWQRLANPQTRQSAIEDLDQATAERLASIS
jgi:hypothetical protein